MTLPLSNTESLAMYATKELYFWKRHDKVTVYRTSKSYEATFAYLIQGRIPSNKAFNLPNQPLMSSFGIHTDDNSHTIATQFTLPFQFHSQIIILLYYNTTKDSVNQSFDLHKS